MPVNSVSIVEIANIAPSASMSAAVTSKPVRIDDRGGIGDQRLGAGKRSRLRVLRGRKGVAGTMADSLGTIAVWGADLANPMSAVPLGNAFAASQTPANQIFAGDGSAVAFQTNIPYAAFSNYNWIVETAARRLVGTVTVVGGVVTGSSTTFNTAGVNILLGDVLVIGGLACVVTAVTSDTAAVVSPAIDVGAGGVAYQVSKRDRLKTYAGSPTLSTQYSVTNGGGFAIITFGVAPPTEKVNLVAIAGGLSADGPGIAVYLVTPVEILADGAHIDETVGIRSRTAMWTIATGDGGDDFDGTRVTVEAAGE